MSDEALAALARQAGIAVDWIDALGAPQHVSPETQRVLLASLGLPAGTDADIDESSHRLLAEQATAALVTIRAGDRLLVRGSGLYRPIDAELIYEDGTTRSVRMIPHAEGLVGPKVGDTGYHRLRLADRETGIAVTPQRCLTVSDLSPNKRLWGIAAQVYALRRDGDCGIGDAGGVADLAVAAAAQGADALALSPVHSLFAADPGRYGPYSPSSRLFYNPLLADPAHALGRERVAAHQTADAPADEALLIEWPRAAQAKFSLLQRLFQSFHDIDIAAETDLARDFHSFVIAGGPDLEGHVRFEAHHALALAGEAPQGNWRDWPDPLPDPAPDRVLFHQFLQWLADRSFAAAQRAALDAGMRIGLISDLAIGMDRAGSHAWSRRSDLLEGVSIGAPPDVFNRQGQDWGLTGFSPRALLSGGFEPFLATLRAAMRHAGGVRIDHIMGLERLWLVPEGGSPADGAYLHYPSGDLLRLLALESHRHRAVVVGEDLGTVPPGFRPRLRRMGIAGMDVLWFERTRTTFRASRRWRHDAVAMTTTHDLPTVAGWWSGADIETRAALDLAQDDEPEGRRLDRRRLWRAFCDAGVAEGEAPSPTAPGTVVDAALAFVASSPAPLMLAPLEDLLGVAEQPNLPGTIDQHPNWRRRFARPAAELPRDPAAARRAALIGRYRNPVFSGSGS